MILKIFWQFISEIQGFSVREMVEVLLSKCLMMFSVSVIESEKLSKMSSLLERLHAKFNQNRPWSETIKLVRQVMVRIVAKWVKY